MDHLIPSNYASAHLCYKHNVARLPCYFWLQNSTNFTFERPLAAKVIVDTNEVIVTLLGHETLTIHVSDTLLVDYIES